MQMLSTRVKNVDWAIFGVRACIATIAIGLLVAIKYLVGLSWVHYALVLVGVVLVSGVIVLSVIVRRRRAYEAAEAPKQTPAPEHSESLDNTEEIPRPSRSARGEDHASDRRPGYYSSGQHDEFKPVVFQRHWKMAVVGSAPFVSVALIVLGLCIAALVGYEYVPNELQVGIPYIFLTMFVLVLVCMYVISRELYRMRNSPMIVERDGVTVVKPKNLFYWFTGGSLHLKRHDILAVNLEGHTFMEMLFFRNVHTTTLDTAATQDSQGHHIHHIVNASQVDKAIFYDRRN